MRVSARNCSVTSHFRTFQWTPQTGGGFSLWFCCKLMTSHHIIWRDLRISVIKVQVFAVVSSAAAVAVYHVGYSVALCIMLHSGSWIVVAEMRTVGSHKYLMVWISGCSHREYVACNNEPIVSWQTRLFTWYQSPSYLLSTLHIQCRHLSSCFIILHTGQYNWWAHDLYLILLLLHPAALTADLTASFLLM